MHRTVGAVCLCSWTALKRQRVISDDHDSAHQISETRFRGRVGVCGEVMGYFAVGLVCYIEHVGIGVREVCGIAADVPDPSEATDGRVSGVQRTWGWRGWLSVHYSRVGRAGVVYK